MQFALLGDIQFELITYFDGLDGKFGSDYAEHALIEGKPRLQWIGDKLDEWSLKLKFHQLYCDPELELARLRKAMGTHTPLPFVLATGEYKGEFVITEIAAVSEQTDLVGALVAVGATLTLREHVPPPGAERQPYDAPAIQIAGKAVPPELMQATTSSAPADVLAGAKSALASAADGARTALAACCDAAAIVAEVKALASDPLAAVARLGGMSSPLTLVAAGAREIGAALRPVVGLLAATAPIAASARQAIAEASVLNGMIARVDAGNFAGALATIEGNVNALGRTVDRAAGGIGALASRAGLGVVV